MLIKFKEDSMLLRIEYCADWSYEQDAAGLAVKLLEYYKHDIEQLVLVPSNGGRFEISVNNVPVFSKLGTDRFPEYGEVKTSIEALSSS